MEKLDNSVIAQNNINEQEKIENSLLNAESREGAFKNKLMKCFNNEAWLNAFLQDDHHGFVHGNQVRLSCLKLISNLIDTEKNELLKEGANVSKIDPEKYVKLVIEIAAIFHDSGRFNEQGGVVAEEQKYHHVLSAERAKKFCSSLGLDNLIPMIEDAILCHDFQSVELTPDLKSPKNISGKIVQASDQMGWFHPDSVKRTLDYNNALGIPFYNNNASFKERIAWRPGSISKDAFTVMLAQLFGPTGKERFGTEYARSKVETYKNDLEKNILHIAKKYNVEEEIKQQIDQAREASLNKL